MPSRGTLRRSRRRRTDVRCPLGRDVCARRLGVSALRAYCQCSGALELADPRNNLWAGRAPYSPSGAVGTPSLRFPPAARGVRRCSLPPRCPVPGGRLRQSPVEHPLLHSRALSFRDAASACFRGACSGTQGPHRRFRSRGPPPRTGPQGSASTEPGTAQSFPGSVASQLISVGPRSGTWAKPSDQPADSPAKNERQAVDPGPAKFPFRTLHCACETWLNRPPVLTVDTGQDRQEDSGTQGFSLTFEI